MAIIDYYNAAVAIDQAGRLVRNAKARVYAQSDTNFTRPLPITDLQGVPLLELESNADGVYPAFRVVTGEMQVMVKSGTALTPLTSLAVYVNAAEAAASMASGSAGAADMSADAAALSASTAVAARDAAVAVGSTNDTIIAGRIKDPTSKTAQAIAALIGGGGGGGVSIATDVDGYPVLSVTTGSGSTLETDSDGYPVLTIGA